MAKQPRSALPKSQTPPASSAETAATPKSGSRSARAPQTVTAVEMGARQREISVSEFFTKNRHLLGFDNPRKALLTCVKEAVDDALDACEEAGILPDVIVQLDVVAPNGGAPPAASRRAVLLIDAVVGPTPLDLEARRYLDRHHVATTVVATKIDKLSRGARKPALAAIRRELDLREETSLIAFSAKSGEGTAELWEEIGRPLPQAAGN